MLKHLRLYFAPFHEFAPGSGLLLALRPILPLGKAEGGLVKLGLALVDGLPPGLEDLAVWFLVGFLVEEKGGFNFNFLLDGVLIFIGPVVVSLLVERVPPPMRRRHRVEIGLPRIGGFVELVNHNNKIIRP